MKTALVRWIFLLMLMARTIPSLAQPQEANHTADKFDSTASGNVPTGDLTEHFESVKAKAEKGDAKAASLLGACYLYGNSVAKDAIEAVKWLRKAADQGDASAQSNLGFCYATGQGVASDTAEAVKWYRKAAEQDYKEACFYLGLHFIVAGSPDYDPAKSFKFFLQGANLGDSSCAYFIGEAYIKEGHGTQTNIVEGFRWIQKSADQGYAMAQLELARRYFEGDAITQNRTNAVRYFELAADNQFDAYRSKLAQQNLWYIYTHEVTNDVAAAKWCRKVAEQGDAKAQGELGYRYQIGLGFMRDTIEAVKWYRKAAEQGFAPAQGNLGVMYYQGQGVGKNSMEAGKWFRKAADQGLPDAQYNLGQMYLNGYGVPKDLANAVKWFRSAAEQGNARGQIELGACYASGAGVPKDYVEGYKWINLASSQDIELANQWLLVMEAKMTAEQIAEAQHLAREFKPRKAPEPGKSIFGKDISDSTASGTGFFITTDGYLITNNHVVKETAQVRLVTSAGLIPAKVVKTDMANDIALLKAEGTFSALPVAASRKVGLGDSVVTLGYPDPGLQGFAPKLAKGEIASLSGAADDARYFQISVPVQPGNSGGALVDERGNVIGIVSAKLDASVALAASGALPENVNYAVKSSLLMSFLESVPDVLAKIKEPNTSDEKLSEVIKSAKSATVMVLVY